MAATLPFDRVGIATNGQMIRWFVRATDTSNVVTRMPSFFEPLRSPEYFGTITMMTQTNNLEILHWFIQNPTGADNAAGTRASSRYTSAVCEARRPCFLTLVPCVMPLTSLIGTTKAA